MSPLRHRSARLLGALLLVTGAACPAEEEPPPLVVKECSTHADCDGGACLVDECTSRGCAYAQCIDVECVPEFDYRHTDEVPEEYEHLRCRAWEYCTDDYTCALDAVAG